MCEHVDKDNVLMLEANQEQETYTCKLCNNTFTEKQVEEIVLNNDDVRLI